MPSLPTVVAATHISDHRLQITFSDGAVKTIDDRGQVYLLHSAVSIRNAPSPAVNGKRN